MNSQIERSNQTIRSYRDPGTTIVDELERLSLLSAIRVGLEQVARGETVLADEAFFESLKSELFQQHTAEPIIEA